MITWHCQSEERMNNYPKNTGAAGEQNKIIEIEKNKVKKKNLLTRKIYDVKGSPQTLQFVHPSLP